VSGSGRSAPVPPRVALATARDVWRDDTDAALTADALRRAGVEPVPAVWDDPDVDWADFPLVVIRSTWDYAPRRDEFVVWARRLAGCTRLANPAEVVAWNTDKRYLDDLAATGVPVVPTRFVPAGADSAQAEAQAAIDAVTAGAPGADLVVKPTVSAGAKDTQRHAAGDPSAAVAHAAALATAGRGVLVQPYLDAVDDAGETGMVFFGGRFSHAFRKGPLLERGGRAVSGLYAEEDIRPRSATPAELSLAEGLLATVQDRFGDPLYARVDVLPGPGGAPLLLELELTEPSFFLATDPRAADRFAAAVLDALR
jgi:glutathione synthase/RimK-type ligase-like ATP-grasp enzyme